MNLLQLIGGVFGSIPSLLGYLIKSDELDKNAKSRNLAWMSVCFVLILGSCYISTRGDNSAVSFQECVVAICSIELVKELTGHERKD